MAIVRIVQFASVCNCTLCIVLTSDMIHPFIEP